MWLRRFLTAIWTAVRGDRGKFDEKSPEKFGDSKNLSYLCTRKLQSDYQIIMNVENKDSKETYKAPKVKEVYLNVQGVLCQSVSGINSMSIDEDGGNDFE